MGGLDIEHANGERGKLDFVQLKLGQHLKRTEEEMKMGSIWKFSAAFWFI